MHEKGRDLGGGPRGGGCRSGWGRLLSVTNAIEAATWRQGDRDWAYHKHRRTSENAATRDFTDNLGKPGSPAVFGFGTGDK